MTCWMDACTNRSRRSVAEPMPISGHHLPMGSNGRCCPSGSTCKSRRSTQGRTTLSGPKLRGVVLPGCADRQTWRPDGVRGLDALCDMRTDGGAILAVHGLGLMMLPLARLRRHPPVRKAFSTSFRARVCSCMLLAAAALSSTSAAFCCVI